MKKKAGATKNTPITETNSKRPIVFVIVGPTAVGKTAYSIGLAKKVHGEIISADSRQVYRGLNIGTGKITKKEMAGIPHYMIDVASPRRVFSAHDFRKSATKHIADILSRGKTPIVVGGTGFYLDALFGKYQLPDVPPNKALREKLEKKTAAQLFAVLKKIDPERSKSVDKNNRVRLIRSIEIAKKLGKVPTLQAVDEEKQPYSIVWMGLETNRESLREKIAIRLKKRLYMGMADEVVALHERGVSWKRLNDLGLEYRYCAMYLQGKISETELVKILNDKIYQYATRQMTWFRKNKKISWMKVK